MRQTPQGANASYRGANHTVFTSVLSEKNGQKSVNLLISFKSSKNKESGIDDAKYQAATIKSMIDVPGTHELGGVRGCILPD